MPGKRLTLKEREDIAYLRGRHAPVRRIAEWKGRIRGRCRGQLRCNISPSPRRYRPPSSHIQLERARRSGPASWCRSARFAAARCISAGRLVTGADRGPAQADYPGQPEMQVSAETIYQALFVQGKGGLRAEVMPRCAAAGRGAPAADGPSPRQPRFPGMISISERPAEAADRAVPATDDLIIGGRPGTVYTSSADRSTRLALISACRTAAPPSVSAALPHTCPPARRPAPLPTWGAPSFPDGDPIGSSPERTGSSARKETR